MMAQKILTDKIKILLRFGWNRLLILGQLAISAQLEAVCWIHIGRLVFENGLEGYQLCLSLYWLIKYLQILFCAFGKGFGLTGPSGPKK